MGRVSGLVTVGPGRGRSFGGHVTLCGPHHWHAQWRAAEPGHAPVVMVTHQRGVSLVTIIVPGHGGRAAAEVRPGTLVSFNRRQTGTTTETSKSVIRQRYLSHSVIRCLGYAGGGLVVGLKDWNPVVRKGHGKESIRVAGKPIDVAFAGDLLHDSLLVVIAQRPA